MFKSLMAQLALIVLWGGSTVSATAVYLNRADWEAALRSTGATSPVSIGFADSEWSDSMLYLPRLTERVSQFNSAPMGVSITSGYSAPGIASNSTLGHVAGGVFSDQLSKYGATTFQFSSTIVGFGGDFDIASNNGLFLGPAGNVGGGAVAYSGFVGFIADQPMDSILISWGEDPHCPYCFGNSYTLSNLEVASNAIPEPGYRFFFVTLLMAGIGCRLLVCRFALFFRSACLPSRLNKS